MVPADVEDCTFSFLLWRHLQFEGNGKNEVGADPTFISEDPPVPDLTYSTSYLLCCLCGPTPLSCSGYPILDIGYGDIGYGIH